MKWYCEHGTEISGSIACWEILLALQLAVSCERFSPMDLASDHPHNPNNGYIWQFGGRCKAHHVVQIPKYVTLGMI